MSSVDSKYSLVEGECLGVMWSLIKAKYYILRYDKLWVSIAHKLLLRVLGDKHLGNLEKLRLVNLKERTLRYNSKIIHTPGLKN